MINNAQKTPPSEEELRYGFGTKQAVESFFKAIRQKKEPGPVILAVNIATLIRNTIGTVAYIDGQKIENKNAKVLNVNGVITKTKSVMVDIANETAQICSAVFGSYKHHILYYLTDPLKQVPKDYIKPQTSEAAVKLQTVVNAFERVSKSEDQTSGDTTMHIRLANQMRVPSYKGIAEVLNGFARYDIPFHLISHMPLDYHVTNYSSRRGYLYRSHTGEICELGPSLGKTVFGESSVPFYPLTHVLLGDKYLVKGCLTPKDKKRFIELARDNHWEVRTSDYIAAKVNQYGFPLTYKLG